MRTSGQLPAEPARDGEHVPLRLPRLPTVRWVENIRDPIVAAALAIGLVVIGAGAGFGGSGGRQRSVPPPAAPAAEGILHHQVLYIAGYDSAYDGQPPPDPRFIAVYSYRGLDPTGNPLPYQPTATHQSVTTSAALLAEQIERLHQRTGKPVALVGLSEGALVTRKYLEDRPHPVRGRGRGRPGQPRRSAQTGLLPPTSRPSRLGAGHRLGTTRPANPRRRRSAQPRSLAFEDR